MPGTRSHSPILAWQMHTLAWPCPSQAVYPQSSGWSPQITSQVHLLSAGLSSHQPRSHGPPAHPGSTRRPCGEEALAIVPSAQAAKLGRIERGEPKSARAGFVRVLEDLVALEPEPAAAALAKVFSSDGAVIQPVAGARQLLIAGLKPQVLEAISILHALDTPLRPSTLVSIPVRHLPPTSTVPLAHRLHAPLATVG